MSHVPKMKLQVLDLDALEKAAEDCGCELVRGQRTYKWWGSHVGDYPLPEGFTAAELGSCEHAIRVKNANYDTYEVGVCKAKNGKGYVLLYDFYGGGKGLMQKIGEHGAKLIESYATQLVKKHTPKGFQLAKREVHANGTVQLTLKKGL